MSSFVYLNTGKVCAMNLPNCSMVYTKLSIYHADSIHVANGKVPNQKESWGGGAIAPKPPKADVPPVGN